MSNSNQKSIIAVVNEASETSMPVNEFVKFRERVYGENGTVFTLKEISNELREHFASIAMYSFKESPLKLLKVLWNSSDHIIHTHQPKSALLITFLTLILPKRFKLVTTVHNNFTKFNIVNKGVILVNLTFAKAICFVSESSYNSFPNFFKKLWKNKIHTITNGVNIESVDSFINQKIKAEKSEEGRVELINVGKLRKQKNQTQLLRIMEKLPANYHLTIIGAGSEKEALEAMIERLNIRDKVTFTGLIPREEVYRYLINSDIFINPALWEGMPIGVLEAMACGLPVLLSDIPPHLEIADNSEEKFICSSDDEYVAKIIEYSSYEQEKLEEIGRLNRKTVDDFYSLQSMHKKYDEVYESIR